jgi:hypothetical protein
MKLTTTVSQQINATGELDAPTSRTSSAVDSGRTSRDAVRCGTKGRTKVCQATLLDARLDAIRRAGL